MPKRLPQTAAIETDRGSSFETSSRLSFAKLGLAHLKSDGDALLKRVRRIAGQVAAIERALAGSDNCTTTLHLVAATRGAMNGLMDKIIEAHVRE